MRTKNKVVGLVLLALLLGFAGNAFSQSSLKKIELLLNTGKYDEVISQVEQIDLEKIKLCNRASYLRVLGEAYSKSNDDVLGYKNLMAAREAYLKCDSVDRAMEINLRLAYIVSQEFDEPGENTFMDEYLAYAEKSGDPGKLLKAYQLKATIEIWYGEHDKADKPHAKTALTYFWKGKALLDKVDDPQTESVLRTNLAVLYSEILHNYDSAMHYLNEDYQINSKLNRKERLFSNLINMASVYNHTGKFDMSIAKLKQANTIPITEYVQKKKIIVYENLRDVYAAKKQYDSAYKYQELAKEYRDSINEQQQVSEIRSLETKYRTKTKELENANLRNRLQNNRLLIVVIVGLLALSLIISYLINKNTARKKTIAEQQRLIETQKLETKLKEQQLHEIDLMLESQEKERQRIADELHDDLGGMLATLKLNIQNIETSNAESSSQLIQKTEGLIEETYQKVRNLSHLKNLGVIGSQGLLVAVKKMAEKMSVINKLSVNVYPYGLENRMENQLEVTLFRMIQELCTNAIKHSGAQTINIYLTQHQSQDLNIIIEDTGKGFDRSKLANYDGMGLKNIEKKTEQLGGTFTLDTTPGKGTTIIIDIPL